MRTRADGTGAATRGTMRRVAAGLLGLLVLLLGLGFLAAGYLEGPVKLDGGAPGAVTVERCDPRSFEDAVCSGVFRSHDGEVRHRVEDFRPGAPHDPGDEVEAVSLSPDRLEPAARVLWAQAAYLVCFGVALCGVAVFLLSGAFRPAGRARSRATGLTGRVLVVGGLAGTGVGAIVAAVLA